MQRSSTIATFSASLVLWLLVFKPTPVLLFGYLGVKFGDILIVLFALIAIVCTPPVFKASVSRNPVALNALLCLLFLEIISALYGSGTDIPTNVLDSFQFVNWINLIIVYFFGTALAPVFIKQYLKMLVIIILTFIVFSWLLFFNFADIKTLTSVAFDYGKSRGIENNRSHLGLFRLASTFNNPNYFGLFCAYLSALGVYLTLIAKGGSWRWCTFTISAALLTLLSGSRTALISLIFAGLCAVFFASLDLTWKKRIFLLYFAAIAAVLLGSSFGIDYISQNFEKLERLNDLENMRTSWYARLLVWNNLSDLNSSIYTMLFGVGSHEDYTGNLDSQYVAAFYRTGLLGLLLVLGLFFWSLSIGGKLRKRSDDFVYRGMGASIQILTIVIAVGSLTAQTFSHFQMATTFILQVAIVEKIYFSNTTQIRRKM